ncbi:MAG: RNA pseudouridine synthase, partial [Alishewanella sp. 32-51-5]
SLFGQHYQYQCWPDHGAYFQQLFEMGLPTAWQNPISLPWPAAPVLAVVDAEQDQ